MTLPTADEFMNECLFLDFVTYEVPNLCSCPRLYYLNSLFDFFTLILYFSPRSHIHFILVYSKVVFNLFSHKYLYMASVVLYAVNLDCLSKLVVYIKGLPIYF